MKALNLFTTVTLLLLSLNLNSQDFIQGPNINSRVIFPVTEDFNNDGQVDVFGVRSFFSGPNQLVVLLSTGTDSIEFTENILDLDGTGQAATGDFDDDGDIDIVIPTTDDFNIVLLINDGSANFSVQDLNISGSSTLKVTDIDNGGDLDIIGINPQTKILSIFTNTGDLNFMTSTTTYEDDLELIELADMDNDSDTDIILGFDNFIGDKVEVLRNNGDDSFTLVVEQNIDFSGGISDLFISDFDDNGFNDIIVTRGFNCLAIYNQGNFATTTDGLFGSGELMRQIFIYDFDKDGRKDAILGTNTEGIYWYKNTSTENETTFEREQISSISPSFSIVGADLDNDEDADIIVTNGDFRWLVNNVPEAPINNTLDVSPESLSIYPNPFSTSLNINNLDRQKQYSFEVTDMRGRLIYTSTSNNNQLDLTELLSGTYLLVVTQLDNQTKKSSLITKM
jgi:hypothetical protein